MVNAAKHAQVDSVDVYAEILAGELSIFVRDRGTGFDVSDIPEDRHGIRESIQARADAAGGSCRIKSAPGEGTEVVLTVAL
ncbi:MAG: ATP-binding protein, partial [Corynebacterium flavescens]|nr:ATP-binding protein [Corynebacterium flavescens]